MQKIMVYTDGASRNNPGEAGSGAYITDGEGNMLKEVTKYLGIATNNFAEYEAIVIGLETVKKMFGDKKTKDLEVEVRMDSELACRQLNGIYQIKEPTLFAQFPHIKFVHIPREKNKEADRLSNEAIDKNSKLHVKAQSTLGL